MRVVIKLPGEDPEIRDVSNDLETLQDLVDGYIEHVNIYEDGKRAVYGLLINEEGKMNGMLPNFKLYGDMIMGPAVFVGEDGEDFTDLTEEQAEMIALHFTEV